MIVSLNMAVTNGGVGRPFLSLTPTEQTFFLKDTVVAPLLWLNTMTLIKLSVLHFYIELFPQRVFKNVVYVVAVLVTGMWVGFLLTTFLMCRPFAKSWNSALPGTCGNLHAFWVASCVLSLLLDGAVVFLPMPILWRLKTTLKNRLSLTLVFGLGIFICIVTVLRIRSLNILQLTDPTLTIPDNLIWTSIEPMLSIISANLPLLPVLFKKKQSASYGSGLSHEGSRAGIKSKSKATANASGNWNKTQIKANRSNNRGVDGWEELNDGVPLNQVHVKSEIKIHKEPVTDGSIGGESGSMEGKYAVPRAHDDRW